MLPNFLQKPIGVVAVLATAVGGPYAAFETELGNSIRRTLISTTSTSNSNNPNASDSYSLLAANQLAPSPSFPSTSSYPNAPQSGWSNSNVTANQPNMAGNGSWNPSPINWPPQQGFQGQQGFQPQQGPLSQPGQQGMPGQVVSTVYGPTTVTPLDMQQAVPNGYYANASNYNAPVSLPQPTLENRSGPSNVIPGGTDKLWDYTLGTPTLPQLQQQPNASVGGGTVTDLREVLRFDIVPGWLPQRFARVSTVTSNVQMDGLRVPLITGTQSKDIAGTLTYYFDAAQSLKRINLHGLTGDPTQLANLMVQFYQLKPEQSLGGQLFTARWNNRVTSVMQISPAPIIYAGADHSKYIIFLELNQPSNQYGLSDEASEILRTSQATQRW